ncbi:hypothetical protein [Leifsonia sp. P73]|uniref:hypothetical protein n=1 Tax=Leifsonia sp. P73 TaxID=3423959 RepID=UPI003DA5CD9D
MRLGDDLAVEGGQPDADVEGAERADDDPAPVRAEAKGAGRAAARRRAVLAVLQEAHLDRRVDALRDDAAAESRQPADLGPGVGLPGADEVHHAQQAHDLVGLRAESECGIPSHA